MLLRKYTNIEINITNETRILAAPLGMVVKETLLLQKFLKLFKSYIGTFPITAPTPHRSEVSKFAPLNARLQPEDWRLNIQTQLKTFYPRGEQIQKCAVNGKWCENNSLFRNSSIIFHEWEYQRRLKPFIAQRQQQFPLKRGQLDTCLKINHSFYFFTSKNLFSIY